MQAVWSKKVVWMVEAMKGGRGNDRRETEKRMKIKILSVRDDMERREEASVNPGKTVGLLERE